MLALTPHTLLSTWEQGRARYPLDRALLLYALAVTAGNPDELADEPLGQRNLALLRLHAAWLGDPLDCCVDCPRCGDRLELALSIAELLRHGASSDVSPCEVDGVRFRRPTTRDLARLATEVDVERAVERLVLNLLVDWRQGGTPSDELASRIAGVLETADPYADMAIDLRCPACQHAWTTALDIAAHLWVELEARARRLLDEVHLLARSYAWSERDILELSEVRRAAYLERVLA